MYFYLCLLEVTEVIFVNFRNIHRIVNLYVLSFASEYWKLLSQVCWGSWQKLLSFTSSPCNPRRSQWTGTHAHPHGRMKGRFGELQTCNFHPGARESYRGDCLEHHHTVYTGQPGHQAWSTWAGLAWQTWSPSMTRWPTQWMKENTMHVVYLGLSKAFDTILLEKWLLMVWMCALFAGYKTGWMAGPREWWSMQWQLAGGGVVGDGEWYSPELSWGQFCWIYLSVIWVRWSSPGNTNLSLYDEILDLTMILSATLWKYLGKAVFL